MSIRKTCNGKEYTYKIKKTEDTKQLTNEQLADRLGEGFTGETTAFTTRAKS